MTATYSAQSSQSAMLAGHHERRQPGAAECKRSQIASPTPPSTHYESHREYVLAVLGRRCSWLDPSDREALWHDAYIVFLEKVRRRALDPSSMRDGQVRTYLTETALHKAMDEGKRAERRRTLALDEGVWTELAAYEAPVEDRVAASFDRSLLREIVADLPDRQRHILALRFFCDHAPQEIQRQLGITARVYRRELERGTKTVADRLAAARQGTYCTDRRGAIIAYVAGIAGPGRSASIRRHLATCPACTRTAAELRSNGLRALIGGAGRPSTTEVTAQLAFTGRLAVTA
jgi:RNA polymerase sigma factor (sigma-70 family)